MHADRTASDVTDRIPLDVLGRWLSNDALNRINRFYGPTRRAHQVDQELNLIGLVAGWQDSDDGPMLMEIRPKPEADG